MLGGILISMISRQICGKDLNLSINLPVVYSSTYVGLEKILFWWFPGRFLYAWRKLIPMNSWKICGFEAAVVYFSSCVCLEEVWFRRFSGTENRHSTRTGQTHVRLWQRQAVFLRSDPSRWRLLLLHCDLDLTEYCPECDQYTWLTFQNQQPCRA